MIHRFGIHLGVLPLWLIGFLIFLPLTWLTLSDVAVRTGNEARLTERPLATVHHRIRGTIQEFENTVDDIGYYEGHLRGYPDATIEARAEWQQKLDAARSEQRLILIKSALVAMMAYLPVGLILDQWYLRGRLQDELAMA